jgi:hypothetical protein
VDALVCGTSTAQNNRKDGWAQEEWVPNVNPHSPPQDSWLRRQQSSTISDATAVGHGSTYDVTSGAHKLRSADHFVDNSWVEEIQVPVHKRLYYLGGTYLLDRWDTLLKSRQDLSKLLFEEVTCN